MLEPEVRKTTIALTKNLWVTGWLVEKRYYISATDTAMVVDKNVCTIAEALHGKILRHLSCNNEQYYYKFTNLEGKFQYITLLSLRCATQYWLYWACQGNPSAKAIVSAMMENNVNRLFDMAFTGEQKIEGEYRKQGEEIYWLSD